MGGMVQCQRFAAIVPVSPAPLEAWRAVEVVKSLMRWEPRIGWCVFIDDYPHSRGLSELALFSNGCRAITLTNLRQGTAHHWLGGLCASTFAALSWIQSQTDADFVLKIDTDALVIAPFADAIRSFLARTPEAGVVGTLGLSCNPLVRARQDLKRESKLVMAFRRWPPAPSIEESEGTEPIEIADFAKPVTVEERRSFDMLRPHIERAVQNGYSAGEYCQGGAFVVTRRMLDRMAVAGYLERPYLWVSLRASEDLTVAMYARSVGLQIHDCSQPGEPFGVQHRGLPYSPVELVVRGHSIIHSVKNDTRYSEAAIRRYFQSGRSN